MLQSWFYGEVGKVRGSLPWSHAAHGAWQDQELNLLVLILFGCRLTPSTYTEHYQHPSQYLAPIYTELVICPDSREGKKEVAKGCI